MSITYPLIIPGSIGPMEANLKKFDAVGEFIGPFDGSAQQQQYPDQHWELDLVWPEMNWAQFAALDAFAGALHGKWGSFLWGPPLAAAPLGNGLTGGNPACVGTDAARSNLLSTQGWIPGRSGLLLPGDFLQVQPLPNPDLTVVQTQVSGPHLPRPGSRSLVRASNTLAVTLSAAPPGDLALGTLTTFAGLTTEVWLNGLTLSLYGIGGSVLTFLTSNPAYGPTADTGSVTYSRSSQPFLQRLYQYIGSAPLASDGAGKASIDIFPSIREAPATGWPIVLPNPQGIFRLAENLRQAPAKRNKTFTFQMKCREAI